MARRLRVKRINTVGFVDKGDDPEAQIVFWKRSGEDIDKRIVQRGAQWCVTTEDGSKTLGCHGTREAALRQLAAVEAVKRHKESPMKAFLKALGEAVGIPSDQADKLLADTGANDSGDEDGGTNTGEQHMSDLDKLQADLAAMTKRAEDAEARVAELEPEGEGDTEEILKDLPEDVIKRFEALEQQSRAAEEKLQKAEEKLQKAEQDRQNEAYVRKAAAYTHIPGVTPDDFGTLLRKMESGLDEDEREKLAEILNATNEALRTSVVYKELGGNGQDMGTVGAEVNKLAEEEMKADSSLSLQAARGLVWKKHPELRRAYDAQRDELRKHLRTED